MTDHPRTSARHKARKHALDILFEADLRGTDPIATLEDRAAIADPPVRELTDVIVRGVTAQRAEIDRRIRTALADGWTLDRMPRVDRVLARMATYELGWTDTESGIVIAEAVRLAGELSTDESPGFLNAVLASIAPVSGR